MADLPFSAPPAAATPVPAVFLDGEILPAATARVPASDRGLLFGAGFFETFRTSGGRPHHWSYNLRRLAPACARVGIPLGGRLAGDEPRLREAVTALLRAHALVDAIFRYTLTLDGTELLTLRPLPPPAPPEGIALRVLNLARDSGEFLPRPKSLNYLNAHLGAEELLDRSADPHDQGLFLARESGSVVETARQNLFWISGDTVFYPDPALGAVAGTCLAWLLDAGLDARPVRAPLDTLVAADAVAVCNSVRGVTPVRALWDAADHTQLRAYGSAAHPTLARFSTAWREALARTAAGSP